MLNTQTERPVPSCFGDLYDKNAKECIGGYDPAYTDKDTGSHIRGTCDFINSCSARTQARKQANQQTSIVPAASLIRPKTTFSTTPTAVPAAYQMGRPTSGPPQQAAATYRAQPVLPQNIPVQHYMPQYLTIREPTESGSIPKRLAIEVVRAMGKSLGHTIAHFFDVEIFGGQKKPEHIPE